MCSKTLEGCGRRFGFDPITPSSNTSLGKDKFSTQVVIPFGGFPGAKNFS